MRYTGKLCKDEQGHIVAVSYNEAGEEVVRVPYHIDNHTTLQDLKMATRAAHGKGKLCQESNNSPSNPSKTETPSTD